MNESQFDPHGYAIASGWDATCVADTARLGVSEADAEGLSAEQQAALLAWCREQVAGADTRKGNA
jgi:hypothetical protein